jgi:hypothetical protein
MWIGDEIGWWLLQNPLALTTWCGSFAALLTIGFGAFLWFRRGHDTNREVPAVLISLGLACVGQLFFLHGWILIGVIFYGEAVMVVVVAHLVDRRVEAVPHAEEIYGPPTWPEAAWFLVIGLVAVFLRFYALNWLLHIFEGELSPFMVGATNIEGMLLANIGWDGPWAPMGLLYYLPIWAMVAVGGSTVLAVRLGSAVIGVLTIIVVYVVVREVIGRTAALWSAALLAVDTLQVGWGRSDMHPHASTAWPGVLLYGATIRALATNATPWYVAVMLLMGLSWHHYPSGQFVVVVPFIAFAIHAVLNRGFFRSSWKRGLFLVGGGALWLYGYSLAYFFALGIYTSPADYVSLLGPRLLGGSDDVVYAGIPVGELVTRVGRNAWDLVLGLFVEAPLVFHQTVIPDVEGMMRKALPWFVVSSAVVGLTLCVLRFRERWSPPLLAMVVAGVLPAVLSDEAWLKRASLLYVVLIIAAAVPLAVVTSGLSRLMSRKVRWISGGLLLTALMLWSSIWVHLWFSRREFRTGVPAETVIVEALERHIKTDTVLIAGLWGDYIEGEVVYLLHDAIVERQPVALYVANPRLEGWRTLLDHPLEAMEFIGQKPWYWLWLGLGDRTADTVRHREWTRVVYLIEDRPDVGSDFEVLSDRCPDLAVERVFVGDDDEVIDGEVWMRYHVWIVSCDGHLGLRTPRFSVPPPDGCGELR